jgi:hypothetical protein
MDCVCEIFEYSFVDRGADILKHDFLKAFCQQMHYLLKHKVLQSVVCALVAVRRTAPSAHSTYCHCTTILTMYFH